MDKKESVGRLPILSNGVIIISVVLLAAVIVLVFASTRDKTSDNNRGVDTTQSVKDATINAELASSGYLKSALNLYYVNNGRYPITLESLNEDESVVEITESRGGNVLSKASNLQSLNYKVRGDSQAYTFTYRSFDGQEKEETANYKEDYH